MEENHHRFLFPIWKLPVLTNEKEYENTPNLKLHTIHINKNPENKDTHLFHTPKKKI